MKNDSPRGRRLKHQLPYPYDQDLSERTAAWVAGCEQGREDVLSLARALAAEEPTGPGGTLTGRLVPRVREEEGTGPATTARSA
jgi:hypothetical protein